MSPRDQARALLLLRKWLNAVTAIEQQEAETATRRFLTDRAALADAGTSLADRIWPRRKARG